MYWIVEERYYDLKYFASIIKTSAPPYLSALNIGKSIQLYTENKSEYNHFDEIKDKVMLKNNRLIIKTEDSDLKISLYQSSIGTGLKPVPKVDRVLVQLMLSQKSIDFWYS